MKAILFSERDVARSTDVPAPHLLPGHALVRVKAAGLCRTDVEVLRGHYGTGAFPLVPGHEYAGVVEAIAPDVTGLRPGDRVAVDPNLPCGQCASCRKGLTNLCERLRAYGVTQNGGFAEFSLVAADHLHDIGTLSYEVAALAEPLACVLNGLDSAGLDVAKSFGGLVFGAGPIGLLLALTLKARGLQRVVIADVNEARLAFCADLGLEVVQSTALGSSREHEFDFVADATGVPAVAERMLQFTADGGTALVFGVCPPDARISVSPFEIFRRQLHLVGSHSLNRNIPAALEILQRDTGVMRRVVTHRLDLDEILPFFGTGPTDPRAMKVQFAAPGV